jgi:hypothetical protein
VLVSLDSVQSVKWLHDSVNYGGTVLGHSIRGLFAPRLRRILISTVVILAVLCAGVYGYLMSLPPPAGPSVTLTSPPIQLSMTLDKTQYSLAENMTISFYLRNISNETVTLTIPSMAMTVPPLVTAAQGVTIALGEHLLNDLFHFGFTIADNNGTALFQYPGGANMETYDIVLEPNASLNQTILIDTRHLTYDQNEQPFQSGAYQISGVLYAGMKGTGLFTWKTPAIALTLVGSG